MHVSSSSVPYTLTGFASTRTILPTTYQYRVRLDCIIYHVSCTVHHAPSSCTVCRRLCKPSTVYRAPLPCTAPAHRIPLPCTPSPCTVYRNTNNRRAGKPETGCACRTVISRYRGCRPWNRSWKRRTPYQRKPMRSSGEMRGWSATEFDWQCRRNGCRTHLESVYRCADSI